MINVIHVSVVDAFNDRVGSLATVCKKDPKIPLLSIIHKRTSEPISGDTIIGNSEKKITIPLNIWFNELTASAINKPKMIKRGVTVKV